MLKMMIKFIVGINGDRVEVKILEDNQITFQQEYEYGYNASYNKMFAKIAANDYENAIKYKWTGCYLLKPFIGDIFATLINTYHIEYQNIECSGYYIFAGRNATKEELEETINRIKKEYHN
jgi:hypothetical protein